MTSSARFGGRPSSSGPYKVGDVVQTPDSEIKAWRYLGNGEWMPDDVVRTVTGPGGGVAIPVGDTWLTLSATLRQQPNQPWPAARPAYDGPITLIGWSDPPAWPGGEYDQFVKIPRINVPIVETFDGYPLGELPNDAFPQSWANRYLSRSIVTDPLSLNNRVLRLESPASGASNGLLRIPGALDDTDQNMLVRLIQPGSVNWDARAFSIMLRVADGDTNRTGYIFAIRSSNPRQIQISKTVNNTATTLGSTVMTSEQSAQVRADGAVVMMRFSVVDTTLTGKLWLSGTDESTAVVVTVTDSEIVSGRAGIGSFEQGLNPKIDYISIAYGGNVAPMPV